jgi:hypothetical protein
MCWVERVATLNTAGNGTAGDSSVLLFPWHKWLPAHLLLYIPLQDLYMLHLCFWRK